MKRNIAAGIKRVVTCFIISGEENVALFRRCATMPTFPSCWAGISGAIEVGETPFQAAQREIMEETNLSNFTINQPGGLYLDVTPISGGQVFRVYPFTVQMSPTDTLELRGTEHDTYRYISIPELLECEDTVPGLSAVFHHATFGRYLSLPQEVLEWAGDKQSGATAMSQRAIQLAAQYPQYADQIAMLRPTMVSVVNAVTALPSFATGEPAPAVALLLRLQQDAEAAVAMGYASVRQLMIEKGRGGTGGGLKDPSRRGDDSVVVGQDRNCNLSVKYEQDVLSNEPTAGFSIATFSRSSTVAAILHRILIDTTNQDMSVRILCGRSTPGDEGLLLAAELGPSAMCVEDKELEQMTREGRVDLVLVGADCVMESTTAAAAAVDSDDRSHAQWRGSEGSVFVNKIGTRKLLSAAAENDAVVYCCTDRWKLWGDAHAPPLESIFELVPTELCDKVLIPEGGM